MTHEQHLFIAVQIKNHTREEFEYNLHAKSRFVSTSFIFMVFVFLVIILSHNKIFQEAICIGFTLLYILLLFRDNRSKKTFEKQAKIMAIKLNQYPLDGKEENLDEVLSQPEFAPLFPDQSSPIFHEDDLKSS